MLKSAAEIYVPYVKQFLYAWSFFSPSGTFFFNTFGIFLFSYFFLPFECWILSKSKKTKLTHRIIKLKQKISHGEAQERHTLFPRKNAFREEKNALEKNTNSTLDSTVFSITRFTEIIENKNQSNWHHAYKLNQLNFSTFHCKDYVL